MATYATMKLTKLSYQLEVLPLIQKETEVCIVGNSIGELTGKA